MLEDMLGFTRKFLSFLTYNAIIMVCQCRAGHLPPPTGLTYKWLDAFTVNVSWKKPVGLLDGSEVGYKYFLMKNGTKECLGCTQWRNFTETCLTEETGPGGWTYTILTDGSPTCNSSKESEPVSINVISNATAKLVKDFKCFIYPNELNCSWIPVHQNLNLTLSYRVCGRFQERIKGLKVCDQPFSSGTRNGCTLKVEAEEDICILVDSEAGMSTFKPVLVVPSPKLHISEDGDHLKLKWTPPEVKRNCVWIYEIRYKKCNEPQVSLNLTVEEGEPMMQMAYDKRCLYKFQSKVMTSIYCKNIFSDFSEVVTYGTNKPLDRTLTVVAIVIPAILSVCVILSCYCFRRHSAIICPIVPDPSAIFKEMMMNGNKELMTTTGSLYTPVPEPIEPCNITPVTVLQQNS